jgi:hypothetical protein
MSSLIEAMAEALAYRRIYARGKVLIVTDTDKEDARAALQAAIEAGPTERMIDAGNQCGDWGPGRGDGTDADPEKCYRAMLRAELEAGEG